jgi:hypothetical protein
MWSPFALLAVVCALPPRSWLRRVDWPVVAARLHCLAVWPIVGLIVWWQVLVTTAAAGRARSVPDCPRHDPKRQRLKRPWWW